LKSVEVFDDTSMRHFL